MKAEREKLAPNAKQLWIEDTQMFQRVAGVAVTPEAELAAEWDAMKNDKVRKFHSDTVRTNRTIQEVAKKAGEERKN